MNTENKHWHVNEFTRELSKRFSEKTGQSESIHYNTVTNWFNALEQKGLHTVSKIEDTRVFDELDMEIALFIIQNRKDKWQLEAIFNVLPKQIELRQTVPDQEKNAPIKEAINEQRLIEMVNVKLTAIGKNIDASTVVLNKQNQLTLEINQLENTIMSIESDLRNIERNKRYIKLMDLKEEVATVAATKNKGFFGRLFKSSADPVREPLIVKESVPAITEELEALNKEYEELEIKKKEIEEELDEKKNEFESLNKNIRNKHTVTLEEAKALLQLDHTDIILEKESVGNEPS